MKPLYSFSIMATKVQGKDGEARHTVIALHCDSLEEAQKEAVEVAFNAFPVTDGWGNHSVSPPVIITGQVVEFSATKFNELISDGD